MSKIPVLFTMPDSIYKSLPGTDVYDIERNALTWNGGSPAVMHPPCRAWSRLRSFSKHREYEKWLAVWAVRKLRKYGGVLEHPAGSALFSFMRLPSPGSIDRYGGFVFPVDQYWFGHRAKKPTWLYIVGCTPKDLPVFDLVMGVPDFVVQSKTNKNHISKRERLATPPPFAEWLLQVVRVISK
jgi:hypothetical protein